MTVITKVMIDRIIGEGSIIESIVTVIFCSDPSTSVSILVTVEKESPGESTARGIPSQSL